MIAAKMPREYILYDVENAEQIKLFLLKKFTFQKDWYRKTSTHELHLEISI